MYTSGHEEIFRDALAMFKERDERAYFDNDELISAISYPDFPCGGIKIEGDVMVDRLRRCGELELGADLLLGNKETMGYQSHYGFYSLWHSMTIDPNMTVSKVAKNVIEYVMICCKLAFERKSMFWLGFALHIVMDSYSPAHVLRAPYKEKGSITTDLIAWIQSYDSDLSVEARTNVEEMRELIKTVVNWKKGPSELIESLPPKHRSAAKFILFDHLQRQETFRLIKTSGFSKTSSYGKEIGGSIMNFYYYPTQKGIFHSVNDLISRVKEASLYEPCVTDVHEILRMFARSKTLVVFLKDLDRLLTHKTYRVHPDCKDSETGFDIVSALARVKKTIRFAEAEDRKGVFRFKAFEIEIHHGDDEPRFSIPMIKQEGAKHVVVHKAFVFSRRKSVSPKTSSVLAYTFIKNGHDLGYPLSIRWNGIEYSGPVLVRVRMPPPF